MLALVIDVLQTGYISSLCPLVLISSMMLLVLLVKLDLLSTDFHSVENGGLVNTP